MSDGVSIIGESYVDTSGDSPREQQPPRRPLVEIGWVLIGQFDKVDDSAIRLARERVREYLRTVLPQFSWRLPLVVRADIIGLMEIQAEPIRLIDQAVAERQSKGWDFAFAFNAADLHALSKGYTLGTPSLGLDAAAISTARLDPAAQRLVVNKSEREQILANRIWALFCHLLGDLVGMHHSDDMSSPMFQPRLPEDLDLVSGFLEDELAELSERLQQVADLRVEEQRGSPRSPVQFAARVVARSGGEILLAAWRNEPWAMIWHLPKFMAAALSTLTILLFTAEVWDVGLRLPFFGVMGTVPVMVCVASAYVISRQRLLTRRTQSQLTEQVVVADLGIILTILAAMVAMSLALMGLALGIIWMVPDGIAERWTDIAIPHWRQNLTLAGLVTVIGLGLGAIGASIEDQTTFRHVAFIDEET